MISPVSLPTLLSLATFVASRAIVPRSTDYTGGTGQGTYYNVTGAPTSCGQSYTDADLIVALSHLFYDTYPGATANPNTNPVCGKKLTATYQEKSVTVTAADRCTGCAMYDLDFTPTAFQELSDLSAGRISDVTWKFIDAASTPRGIDTSSPTLTNVTSTTSDGSSGSSPNDGDNSSDSASGANSTSTVTGSGTILNSTTTIIPADDSSSDIGKQSVTHLTGNGATINSTTNSNKPDGSTSVTTSSSTSTHLNSVTTSGRRRSIWARDWDFMM